VELEGVYVISVAARILDMHPQTLRKYERLGLINPVRTMGMLRLYSLEDIRKVLLIRHLMENLGLNLAGVEFALTVVNNLINMGQRLGQAAEGTPLEERIREEIQQLFRNLNLPVSE
jgi:MerR family transcriptional regulator/heat shock protein HspR